MFPFGTACFWRRQLPLRPGLELPHGPQKVPGLMVICDLHRLQRLRPPDTGAASKFSQGSQLLPHGFHVSIALSPAALLQGLDQGLHLALGLLVLDGEEHPGFQVDQVGGHGGKLAGGLQVQPLPLVQPAQVLVADQGDGDILNLHLVLTQQKQNQVQGPLKVLKLLRPGVDHFF